MEVSPATQGFKDMRSLFMGVDIGTSGVRAALFDTLGNQVSLYHKEYAFICLEQGMAELDPEIVFSSIITVVRECITAAAIDKNEIAAIAFSTQLFSFLAVDSEGKCLTNIITWADTRSIKQAEELKEKFDFLSMYNNTGCRVQHPMYPLSKILCCNASRSSSSFLELLSKF